MKRTFRQTVQLERYRYRSAVKSILLYKRTECICRFNKRVVIFSLNQFSVQLEIDNSLHVIFLTERNKNKEVHKKYPASVKSTRYVTKLLFTKKLSFSATLMTVGSVSPKRSSPEIKAGKILMHSAVLRSSCMGSSTFMHTPRHDPSLTVVGLQQMQCSGSGSTRLGIPDPNPSSSSKNSKKNLDSYGTVL
jgi:hypothetical protein